MIVHYLYLLNFKHSLSYDMITEDVVETETEWFLLHAHKRSFDFSASRLFVAYRDSLVQVIYTDFRQISFYGERACLSQIAIS